MSSAGNTIEDAMRSGTLLQRSKRRKGEPIVIKRATLSTANVANASALTSASAMREKFDIVAIQPLSNPVLEEVRPGAADAKPFTL